MRFVEDHVSLGGVCRAVEQKLSHVPCLMEWLLPVSLRQSFDEEPEAKSSPCYKNTPAAYRLSIQKVLINKKEFFKLSSDTAEVVLLHEVGHAYCHQIDPELRKQPYFASVNDTRIEDLLADYLICQWGMEEELILARQPSQGRKYCDALRLWRNTQQYVDRMEEYLNEKLIRG